jgi:hypothetical protein
MADAAMSEHIGKKLPEEAVLDYRNYIKRCIKSRMRGQLLNNKDKYIDYYQNENRTGIGATV